MRVALLLALLLLACCPTATPGKAKKKKVTSQASPAAARRCAVCAFLVEHLRDRAEEAAAAGTSYEMGWRLKPDGTRVEKRVPWAESELGFGAAVEAACEGCFRIVAGADAILATIRVTTVNRRCRPSLVASGFRRWSRKKFLTP